ncbi:MAG: AAA family ATPase [Gemmatimonadota bacterium]
MNDAVARHAELVSALMRPAAYPHPAERIELIETHISSVLLAGAYAYKVKKPVDLGFVDFSTLERRRFYCEEEVRLNRRTAPDLYLGVVPITGSPGQPRVAGDGEAIDYAVQMRRFDNDALLDVRARRGALQAAEIDRLAQSIAELHAVAARATPESDYGTPERVLHWARENFTQLRARALPAAADASLSRLAAWTAHEFERRRPAMVQRAVDGFIRECHGDLHLGNIVLLDGRPTLFDAIEFNPQLHWIDVASDVAFVFMDLFDHGMPRFAWRLLDRYLQASGDYGGLQLLRFYAVYRALVRAKVALIRADQPQLAADARAAALARCAHCVRLAETLQSGAKRPLLAITFGLSGAGKTTVAGDLLERLGAVRVRSDVERKRLFGIGQTARMAGGELDALYAQEANRRTYGRLAELARTIFAAGYPAIVDAAFLKRAERDEFRALARDLGARFALIECVASPAALRARLAQRAAHDTDASDATVAVLERQMATHEPVADDERADTFTIATDADASIFEARCGEAAARLAEEN